MADSLDHGGKVRCSWLRCRKDMQVLLEDILSAVTIQTVHPYVLHYHSVCCSHALAASLHHPFALACWRSASKE